MSESPQIDPDAFEDPLSNYEPAEYESEIQRALAEEPVSSITSRPYAHVGADTTVAEAVQELQSSRVSCLLVVEDGKLTGIFTERDVLERVSEQFERLASTPVRDLMTSDPTVVYESDPVGTAVEAIAIAGHRHVPVLKLDGTPIGVLSPRRVFGFLEGRFDDAPPPEPSETHG